MPKFPWWVVVSLVLTASACLASLSMRYRVEAANRAVGLAMEAETVADLAESADVPLEQAFLTLKEKGLTGVTLTEETVGDLIARGSVTLGYGFEGPAFFGSTEDIERIEGGALRRFGPVDPPLVTTAPIGKRLVFKGNLEALRATPVGLNPAEARAAKGAGLVIIARHANVPGAGTTYILDTIATSQALGATAFLIQGDTALGYRELLGTTANGLRTRSFLYASPEFVRLAGDSRLVNDLMDRTLRLHSIQQAEADRMSPGAIEDRFVRAYRERNIRWLLVRPLSLAGNEPIAQTAQFLGRIKNDVAREGGAVREPRPFTDPGVPSWLFLVIGLAAAPTIIWVGLCLVPWRPLRFFGAGLVLAVGAGCLVEPLRGPFALLAAIAFPVAAYLWLQRQARVPILTSYLVMASISLVGGLVVAGLLNGLPYFLTADQFSGVKLAHFFPIVIVGGVLASAVATVKDVAERPVLYGTAVLILVGLGAVAFMMSRTGNDNPAGVSPLELQFRALLDNVLYTRPRTKEFLIGHPALIVGLGLYGLSKSDPRMAPWSVAALTLGAIGLTSIVNTMCHLHTPLDVSLPRIAIGLVLGGILGGAAWWVIAWALRRRGRAAGEGTND